MKLSKTKVVPIFLCLILTGIMAMGAAPDEKPDKEPVDKIVFVHYPKDNPGNAYGKPGGSSAIGGTGVLSNDYKYSGIHWSISTATAIKYYVNPIGSGVLNETAIGAIQAAMTTWDNASSKLGYNTPITNYSLNAGIYDYHNVISWANISLQYPSAIAVTSVWYYRFNKQIAEVDTQMNNGAGFAWSYNPPNVTNDLSSPAAPTDTRYGDPTNSVASDTYDIRNIMTHEAGHWLMLGDLYNSTDSELTMYGYGSTGELKKDTLGYGDELGVERIYGQ